MTMLANQRVFHPTDPDAPTTPALRRRLAEAGRLRPVASNGGLGAGQRCGLCGCILDSDADADRSLPACGSCKLRPEARLLRNSQPARSFTDAERSLIRKIHGYLPPLQLLGILNDRLRSDLGLEAQPYTIEQLHTEIAAIPGAQAGGNNGWAGLRRLLAQARRDGVLDRINEQVINDFAVVFSLSPKQLMRLKDIVLQAEEE
jgi:hypothetical protein